MSEIQIYKPYINEHGIIYMLRTLYPHKVLYRTKCVLKKNEYNSSNNRVILCLNSFLSAIIEDIYKYLKDLIALLFDKPISHSDFDTISKPSYINARLSKKLNIEHYTGYKEVTIMFDSIFVNNDNQVYL